MAKRWGRECVVGTRGERGEGFRAVHARRPCGSDPDDVGGNRDAPAPFLPFTRSWSRLSAARREASGGGGGRRWEASESELTRAPGKRGTGPLSPQQMCMDRRPLAKGEIQLASALLFHGPATHRRREPSRGESAPPPPPRRAGSRRRLRGGSRRERKGKGGRQRVRWQSDRDNVTFREELGGKSRRARIVPKRVRTRASPEPRAGRTALAERDGRRDTDATEELRCHLGSQLVRARGGRIRRKNEDLVRDVTRDPRPASRGPRPCGRKLQNETALFSAHS
jgi:hypothetical protein